MSGLVADYGSDSDGGGGSELDGEPAPTTVLARRVEAAPRVVGAALAVREDKQRQKLASTRKMMTNLPAALVRAPIAGPASAFARKGLDQMDLTASNVHAGGSVERAAVEDWSFHEQFHTFQSYGYAMDASGGTRLVGDADAIAKNGGHTVSTAPRGKRRRRKDRDDGALGDEDDTGVWAPMPEEGGGDDGANVALTAEEKADLAEALAGQKKAKREYDQNEDFDRRDERKVAHLLPARHDRDTVASEATSTFHGESLRDYQGRPWTAPPKGDRRADDPDHDCFIPKRCIHKFTGHAKGVQCVRPVSKHGHLLLSASLDGTAKIWDVAGDRRCLRTYAGHTEALRDANLSADATRLATCGFDRFTRVWDVETGACLHTLTPNRKMAYCVDFYPRDENVLLAGASDNRIYQWDLRANEAVVQEYNHHLQPVNSITFVDDDRRFVSTSDDKKIFVWEHNIPVPMKYISEPCMSSVPIVELHPSTQFWCGQSMDNTIVTYGARDRMKQIRKKTFKGHLNSGYACGLTFSPNGKYLASGDGEGKLIVWDFKSTRVYRKIQAHHGGPCIGAAWHPVEPSWLFTCGWDGMIKLWD